MVGRGGKGREGGEGKGREGRGPPILHPQFQFSRNMPGMVYPDLFNSKFCVIMVTRR